MKSFYLFLNIVLWVFFLSTKTMAALSCPTQRSEITTHLPLGFYTLAQTCLKEQHPFQALAYLQKATTLAPHDHALKQSVTHLTEWIHQKHASFQFFPAQSTWDAFLNSFFYQILSFISTLIIFFILIFLIIQKTSPLASPLLLGSACLLSVFLSLKPIWNAFFSYPQAVLLQKTTIHTGPQKTYPVIATFLAGQRVFWIPNTQKNHWVQIQFLPSEWGWIPQETLLPLLKNSITTKKK